MKRLCALLMGLCLLCTAALADVIPEPYDDFYAAHARECVHLARRYTANSPEGYVTLYKAPDSLRETATVRNGSVLSSGFYYQKGGETWLAIWDEGSHMELMGWVRDSDCVAVPDYLTFQAQHGEEFFPFDDSLGKALEGTESVVLWTYPGSGEVAWEACPTSWFQDPGAAFSDCWEDGEGRVWGFCVYAMGYRNTWVCLSDPADPDLPALEGVVNEDVEWQPVAIEYPAPRTGVPALAVALVLAVVAGTAVLIPRVCGKRRPRA